MSRYRGLPSLWPARLFVGILVAGSILGVIGEVAQQIQKAHAAQPGAIAVLPEGANQDGYFFAITGSALYATPTDWVTLCNPGGTTPREIHPTRIEISATATTAGSIDVILIKRTAANTGGTITVQTPGKMRTTRPSLVATPAAAAVFNQYTAIPASLGTGIQLASVKLGAPLAGVVTPPVVFDFGRNNEPDLALLAANECLALNFNGDAVPAGGSFNADWRWTEWGQP